MPCKLVKIGKLKLQLICPPLSKPKLLRNKIHNSIDKQTHYCCNKLQREFQHKVMEAKEIFNEIKS